LSFFFLDSDGLEGLSKVRRCSNPEEQILEQEHRGNWAVALDWYEGAIRISPGERNLFLAQDFFFLFLNFGFEKGMLVFVLVNSVVCSTWDILRQCCRLFKVPE
jgi:hypothetical protein